LNHRLASFVAVTTVCHHLIMIIGLILALHFHLQSVFPT
jgi:hypothetical protein